MSGRKKKKKSSRKKIIIISAISALGIVVLAMVFVPIIFDFTGVFNNKVSKIYRGELEIIEDDFVGFDGGNSAQYAEVSLSGKSFETFDYNGVGSLPNSRSYYKRTKRPTSLSDDQIAGLRSLLETAEDSEPDYEDFKAERERLADIYNGIKCKTDPDADCYRTSGGRLAPKLPRYYFMRNIYKINYQDKTYYVYKEEDIKKLYFLFEMYDSDCRCLR